jgi:lysophospholipase L1-like esterase
MSMRKPLRTTILAAGAAMAVAMIAALAAPASAGTAAPNSMASTGDSLTQAFNADNQYQDRPQYSWSTGTDPAVNSHYQRLLAVNPNIAGKAYNYSRSGARMSDLDRQLKLAAGQKVEYVTVLMGGNDVCRPSIAEMTPVNTYQAQFQQAMSNFVAANPRARIFVSSIPSVYQMWSTLKDNPYAQATWQYFGICQSMLNPNNTEADRARVDRQQQAYNRALANVCNKFDRCQWDNNAAYNFKTPASDFSTADYFHPNITGQNDLAAVSAQTIIASLN